MLAGQHDIHGMMVEWPEAFKKSRITFFGDIGNT